MEELIKQMGMLAIQIKQDAKAIEEKEKRYDALTAQVLLLQTMQQEQDVITKPDPESIIE